MRLRNHFSRRGATMSARSPPTGTDARSPVQYLSMEALLTQEDEVEAEQAAAERVSQLEQRVIDPQHKEAHCFVIDCTSDDDDRSVEADKQEAVAIPMRTRRERKSMESSDGVYRVELRHKIRRRKPLQRIPTPRKVGDRNDAVDQFHSPTGNDAFKRAAASYSVLLQDAFAQEDEINESNWLTSTLIDLMLWRLATQYTDAHFLATDFCHLHLPSVARATRLPLRSKDHYQIRDVLGRPVEYDSETPIIFVANVGQIHWNLLRIQFQPYAELQLFEPMGRLSSRSGISYRSVPRCVVEWLDICYPQPKSWLSHGVSAITRPQQVSGFDCGVACLLYADKCGQGQPREAIDATTDQQEITTFRSELRRRLRTVLHDDRRQRTA